MEDTFQTEDNGGKLNAYLNYTNAILDNVIIVPPESNRFRERRIRIEEEGGKFGEYIYTITNQKDWDKINKLIRKLCKKT